MFGTNPIRRKSNFDGDKLLVQDVFSTVQGEGPFAGAPAIFLRLAGCNLRCHFCDTDFESRKKEWEMLELVRRILMLAHDGKVYPTKLLVITGGEPMLQNIEPLIKEMTHNHNFLVQIETAGTTWVPGIVPLINTGLLTLVCSPKTGSVAPEIAEWCTDWKYLIQEGCVSPGDGLPNKSTQVPGKDLMLARPPRATDTVWLQPCEAYTVVRGLKDLSPLMSAMREADGLSDQTITSSVRDEAQTQRNVALCAALAMKYNYRISLQLHKLLHLP